jgi:hypothetical protein
VAYQHQPSARDAGLTRVAVFTTAFTVAGVVATGGIMVSIAAAAPNPKAASADYTKGKPAVNAGKPPVNSPGKNGTTPGKVTPPEEKPESSSGDEQTTSGGS